jgi:hypothetical protein
MANKHIKMLKVIQVKNHTELGVIVHACDTNYAGGRGRRITSEAGHRQKHETLSEK